MSRRQPARPAATGGRPTDISPRLTVILVAAALVAGFALRAIDLGADPPPDLSWSSAIYSDEAHNALSARNLALYGRWQVDDYAPFVVYPWLNLFTGAVLRVAGTGLVQLRLVSLLAGVLLILAMYHVGRTAGRRAGALAALVTAFAYPLVMYSRLGLAEMTQVALVAATVAFLARAGTSRLAAALSGCAAFAAILFVKVSALFIPAAALLLFVHELIRARRAPAERRSLLVQSGWWLAGAALPLALWLALIFIPHRETWLQYVIHHSFGAKAGHPDGPVAYLLNAFSVGAASRLFARVPAVAALGFALLPAFARRRSAAFAALVLVAGVVMLGYGYYHPPRYELFAIVPLIVGFVLTLDRLLTGEARLGHPWPRLSGVILYGLWLWPLALQLLYRRPGPNALLIALLVGLAASSALWALHRSTGGGLRLGAPALRIGLAALLAAITLGRDVTQYAAWYGSRTTVMRDAARDIDAALPDNAVTGGFWAPALLAASAKRALFISDQWGANTTDPVGRFGLTHLVIADENEFRFLDSITGGSAARGRIIRQYPVRDRRIAVVELAR